jgi:hypothetical protein
VGGVHWKRLELVVLVLCTLGFYLTVLVLYTQVASHLAVLVLLTSGVSFIMLDCISRQLWSSH